jgi:hypothetical protein
MKTYKWIDAYISACLIVFFLVQFIVAGSLEQVIIAYFITGAWQTISMIIHAVNKWFTRKWGPRHTYHWITVASWVSLPIGSYWILLFTAPFMAVFYTVLCFHECFTKMSRPISVLK